MRPISPCQRAALHAATAPGGALVGVPGLGRATARAVAQAGLAYTEVDGVDLFLHLTARGRAWCDAHPLEALRAAS